MGGATRKAYLYTADGTFVVPGTWNKRDNIIHAIGRGGNGRAGVAFALIDQTAYVGGGGGGGGAWAALVNAVLTFGLSLDVSVTSSVFFGNSGLLLADNGQNAPSISGGSASGGDGGAVLDSVGDLVNAGGNGASRSQALSPTAGGGGGGAGGPNGTGGNGSAQNQGQADGGSTAPLDPRGKVTAAPGDGGQGSFTDESAGHDGLAYGGGAGGGAGSDAGSDGGTGAPGCVLIINNASM
jgi:hypothetical protein